jgi:hypothetical protein
MSLVHKAFYSRGYILVLLLFFSAVCYLISDHGLTYAQEEKACEKLSQKAKELENITIDNKGYKKDRKGPSQFTHVKHAREYKISCWACHHEYDENKKITWSPWGETKKCSECHDPIIKKGNMPLLQAAYHKNCKGCHKERKIFKDDNLAYRKCTYCHK